MFSRRDGLERRYDQTIANMYLRQANALRVLAAGHRAMFRPAVDQALTARCAESRYYANRAFNLERRAIKLLGGGHFLHG